MRWTLVARRRLGAAWVILAAVVLLTGCATKPTAARAPLLVISMDGFRWDYLARHPEATPHLRQLAAEGVVADGLVPVFPSNTFPSHYSIATGLYPSHHGIVNNRMFDAELREFFVYNLPKYARDGRWWRGEPIWITAVRQNRPSACSFWPGSEASIGGLQATFWKPYDYSVPFAQRLDELIGWLTQPGERRPAVVTFYLEETNSVGHKFGPDSPEIVATLRQMDERIAAIQARAAAAGVPLNLVLVSDHGMTSCGADRVVLLDDFIDLAKVQVDFDESVAGLRPAPGVTVDEICAALTPMPHVTVYRSHELPARWHIDPRHPRVPPVWVVPEPGWNVMRRAGLEKVRPIFSKGQHGYDPEFRDMHGLFIAHGPAFRRGVKIGRIEQVHVYNLLCATAGLRPAPNDGDDRLVKAALR